MRLIADHLNRFPAVRIIHAGLEKHELGGYHWMTASEKVDRAIESRAASELENLRRRSLMDWLWNLGTLSPLIGLFGTGHGHQQRLQEPGEPQGQCQSGRPGQAAGRGHQ